MQIQQDIIDCYNKTAKSYADKFIDELNQKHLDKILLKAFARENSTRGKLIDLGCGPGQTTKFLSDCGFTEMVGIDISAQMVGVAKSINPQLTFEIADILSLKYADNSFGSAIAFYAIVHFDYDQLETAFKEIKRVLVRGGELLFSFHIGNNILHLDRFLEQEVSIDFYFFEINKVTELLIKTGFEIIDTIERKPYKEVEYPSNRAYIWTKTADRPLTS